jgi:hypothetical protein
MKLAHPTWLGQVPWDVVSEDEAFEVVRKGELEAVRSLKKWCVLGYYCY